MADKPVRVHKHERSQYTRRHEVHGMHDSSRLPGHKKPIGARDDGTALKNLDDARESGETFEMEIEGQPIDRASGMRVITEQLDYLLRRELLMSPEMYVVIPEDIIVFPANSFTGSFRIYRKEDVIPDTELDTHVASGGVTGSFVGGMEVGRLTDIQAQITDVEV